MRAAGASVAYFRADVGEPADRARLVAAVRERFSRLHVLVNNAGVAPRERADILEAAEESFERLLRVNLQGPYFLTQAVARFMLEQKGARRGLVGLHRERHLDVGDGRLDEPRRVLREQGRARDGLAAVGRRASPGRASPSTRCGRGSSAPT